MLLYDHKKDSCCQLMYNDLGKCPPCSVKGKGNILD